MILPYSLIPVCPMYFIIQYTNTVAVKSIFANNSTVRSFQSVQVSNAMTDTGGCVIDIMFIYFQVRFCLIYLSPDF